jgi:hypothetical protein
MHQLIRRYQVTAVVLDDVLIAHRHYVMTTLYVLVQYFLQRGARVCLRSAKVFALASTYHLVPNGHAHRVHLMAVFKGRIAALAGPPGFRSLRR